MKRTKLLLITSALFVLLTAVDCSRCCGDPSAVNYTEGCKNNNGTCVYEMLKVEYNDSIQGYWQASSYVWNGQELLPDSIVSWSLEIEKTKNAYGVLTRKIGYNNGVEESLTFDYGMLQDGTVLKFDNTAYGFTYSSQPNEQLELRLDSQLVVTLNR